MSNCVSFMFTITKQVCTFVLIETLRFLCLNERNISLDAICAVI